MGCEGGEDEYDCPAPDCDSGEFTCSEYKFNHTSCIAPHWRCDKQPDCPDKSDEANCSKWMMRNVSKPCRTRIPSAFPTKWMGKILVFHHLPFALAVYRLMCSARLKSLHQVA